MDYHTQITNSPYETDFLAWFHEHKTGDNRNVFPLVNIENESIYFKKDNKKREIEMIDNLSTNKILSFFQSYFNDQLSKERNRFTMEGMFSCWLEMFGNIRAPFVVKYKGSKKEEIIRGIDIDDYIHDSGTAHTVNLNGPSDAVYYAVYPSSSTAILTVNSFSQKWLEKISQEVTAFMDSINKSDIKYLFLDLSLNGGGKRCFDLLDIVPHDTIYESYKAFNKKDPVLKEYRDIVRLPNRNQGVIDRQLFVIQGNNTRSGADYFCRIIKQNNMGVLVGQNTGEPTVDFTFVDFYKTPHTRIEFSVATAYRDYSDSCPDETLHPDMYWDVNYRWSRHSDIFSEKELQSIVKQWNKQKKNWFFNKHTIYVQTKYFTNK
ncbi:MAG: S41 family peptidase [Dysgonamonadaceae bacterium]|nr:S41 family peptidase [Dysgonamonadaceae bacterium]